MKILEVLDPHIVEGPYRDGRVLPRLPDGSPPQILYRIMSMTEYQHGIQTGQFSPRERIHASIRPLFQFAEPGNQNVLVAIDYDDRDGWQCKWMGDELVAITHSPILASKVHLVSHGTRQELTTGE